MTSKICADTGWMKMKSFFNVIGNVPSESTSCHHWPHLIDYRTQNWDYLLEPPDSQTPKSAARKIEKTNGLIRIMGCWIWPQRYADTGRMKMKSFSNAIGDIPLESNLGSFIVDPTSTRLSDIELGISYDSRFPKPLNLHELGPERLRVWIANRSIGPSFDCRKRWKTASPWTTYKRRNGSRVWLLGYRISPETVTLKKNGILKNWNS